jgi:hypothetical protein
LEAGVKKGGTGIRVSRQRRTPAAPHLLRRERIARISESVGPVKKKLCLGQLVSHIRVERENYIKRGRREGFE